jgi:hypothetical protein
MDGVQWYDNIHVVLTEIPLVGTEAQKASDLVTDHRLGPIHDSTGFMFRGVDAILVNIIYTKVDFLIDPNAFYTCFIESVLHQQGHYISDMFNIFHQGIDSNYSSLKAYNHEFVHYWIEDAILHAYNLTTGICQAKSKYSPLV